MNQAFVQLWFDLLGAVRKRRALCILALPSICRLSSSSEWSPFAKGAIFFCPHYDTLSNNIFDMNVDRLPKILGHISGRIWKHEVSLPEIQDGYFQKTDSMPKNKISWHAFWRKTVSHNLGKLDHLMFVFLDWHSLLNNISPSLFDTVLLGKNLHKRRIFYLPYFSPFFLSNQPYCKRSHL